MRTRKTHIIRRRALRVEQDREHPLFLFVLTSDELEKLADISRVSRDEAGKLIGYQRPEVKRHVQNIVEYLNSEKVIFPNSLILALPSNIKFTEARGPRVDDGYAAAGTIEIPIPCKGQLKPAWIVDGQQRALALSKSIRRNLPVPISAFIADDVDMQRDQFLRINSTKPLPRGLITELLPEVSTVLPANLANRKAPSAICELLNRDPYSPFLGLIHRASTGPGRPRKAIVSDTVLVKVIQDSLSSPSGCLFPYRNLATGETDYDSVRLMLISYWNAVKATFPGAWGLPPTQSRLMHSVGLKAMGRLMDRIMSPIHPKDSNVHSVILAELARVKSVCRWTSGNWEELGGLKWNELQNVSSHVKMLTNLLIRAHLSERKLSA